MNQENAVCCWNWSYEKNAREKQNVVLGWFLNGDLRLVSLLDFLEIMKYVFVLIGPF